MQVDGVHAKSTVNCGCAGAQAVSHGEEGSAVFTDVGCNRDFYDNFDTAGF